VAVVKEEAFFSVEESNVGSVIETLEGVEIGFLGIIDEASYISSSIGSVIGSKY
jgi:hypothetical protein